MDRNDTSSMDDLEPSKSLSARRAWIEIVLHGLQGLFVSVALRKESVDRNCVCVIQLIECGVALRKESVDRNNDTSKKNATRRRSPQGERG